jgi:hypothetical protein
MLFVGRAHHSWGSPKLDFDKAIEVDPNNQNAYERRGNFLSESGDAMGASRDFEKAKELAAIKSQGE